MNSLWNTNGFTNNNPVGTIIRINNEFNQPFYRKIANYARG